MVFGESTLDDELFVLASGIGKADLACLEDGDDGGMMLEQGEWSQLAWHRDGAGFTFK